MVDTSVCTIQTTILKIGVMGCANLVPDKHYCIVSELSFTEGGIILSLEVSILTFALDIGACLEVTYSFNCTRELHLS